MPLVSVVIATYNRANFIGRAIDSILSQTYNNFELIVVDDGCTDNTSQILEKYAAKEKRIILLKQNNQGLASARNAGVDKAQGKYIAFMDDDDVSLPKRLEKQVTFLEKYPDYQACICVLDFIDLDGKIINNNIDLLFHDRDYYPLNRDPYQKKEQHIERVLGALTCITKESFINCNGYRVANDLIIEDLDFTFRFLRKYKAACIGVEYLYLYTAPEENFGNNLSSQDSIKYVKRHIVCYISHWFRSHNMNDPVEEDLKLDEILALITKLPKSDRYAIFESVRYWGLYIMKEKKISRRRAKKYISMITRTNRAEKPLGYFWLRLYNLGL